MAELRERDQRDLVLAPNEFAFIQDKTKGEILTHVGPTKGTLGGDDIPMKFDSKTKQFAEVGVNQVKQTFITAPAGWYVILLNPAGKHPKIGTKNSTPEDMIIGKKIVIPGPCSFALWPGQMADVIEGHRLRSNQYLFIEVYDDAAARENWTKATVKTAGQIQDGAKDSGQQGEGEDKKPPEPKAPAATNLLANVPDDLANGKRYVIRGTEIAFYIPPTGVKVVKDKDGNYLREAVTLEKPEYSVLLDENGEKQFDYGSKVVFPEPTQTFVTDEKGNKKFKAFELDARKGVYVKVIEAYEDDDGKHKPGDEIFITGEGMIYYPRKEHSIIKYGNQEVHYAIAIPKGEGRYVLNRESGDVVIAHGPKMLLPDPRCALITRRILTEREAKLIYPGNPEVLTVNMALAAQNKEISPQALAMHLEKELVILKGAGRGFEETASRLIGAKAEERFGGDAFERKTEFTPPRTIILDTKYQGVPPVNVWTGYAVKVVDKTGKGRVVVGPDAFLLEYDETLEPMSLSTGKPKSTDKLLETAYLKVKGNKVSDIVIRALTTDMVDTKITLSYRVDFEGDDPLKWFALENYVGFLCEHCRSVLISTIKKCKIADLHARSTEIIRDAILGKKPAQENSDRPGMKFSENNMRIYDVEVLDVTIGNQDVNRLLVDAELNSIVTALKITRREQDVAATKTIEKLNRAELEAKRATEKAQHEAGLEKINEAQTTETKNREGLQKTEKEKQDHQQLLSKSKFDAEQSLKTEGIKNDQARLEVEKAISAERRDIKIADNKVIEDHEKTVVTMANEILVARATHSKEIAQAFGPELVRAINNLGDKELVKALSGNFGNLSILEGKGVLATATRFLDIFPEGQGLIESLKKTFGGAPEAASKAESAQE